MPDEESMVKILMKVNSMKAALYSHLLILLILS
jgi:hypothetical protein